MFAPHPGKTRTLKDASTWLLGCNATSARKSLEQKSINDHMITLSLPERAAIHCICWIFSRIMSTYFREELNWESISWKIEGDIAVNCPEWLRMIIMTLNARNIVYDYIEQGRSLSEDTVALDSHLLSDYSSYLALTRLERYHHVHRLCDSKWISFCYSSMQPLQFWFSQFLFAFGFLLVQHSYWNGFIRCNWKIQSLGTMQIWMSSHTCFKRNVLIGKQEWIHDLEIMLWIRQVSKLYIPVGFCVQFGLSLVFFRIQFVRQNWRRSFFAAGSITLGVLSASTWCGRCSFWA